MAGAIDPTNGLPVLQFVDKDKTGFNGLTSESFLKLLITQLQNQDPLEPMDNEQLLSQISQMRALQSNIELSSTLKGFSLGQQLTSGSALIDKAVQGTDKDGKAHAGIVDRVVVRDGTAYVGLGSIELPVNNITQVAQAG